MKSNDIIKKYFSLDGAVCCIDQLTENAQPEKFYDSTEHEYFEIYWFLKCDLRFAFEGEFIDISPGDMIIISNGILHRPMLNSTCDYHRKCISFTADILIKTESSRFSLYDMLRNRKIIKINKKDAQKYRLDRLFEKICESIANPNPYNDMCTIVNLSYFLITADSIYYKNKEFVSTIYNTTALEIIKYINTNIHTDLNYKTIAEIFHFSENGLYKFFKKETGFTLGKYIRQRRIIKAKSVLNSGQSAQIAARKSGFSDYSVFYRSFVQETKMSPIEYLKLSPKITDKILIMD